MLSAMKGEATASASKRNPPPSFLCRLCCILSPKKPDKAPLLSVRHELPGLSTDVRPGEFEHVFHYFDEDGDGKISPTELRNRMRTFGEELSAEDAEAVVGSTDSDGDGLLGLEDFIRLVDAEEEEEKGRNLKEAFKMYEMEGKGCITPKSLKRALGRLGEPNTTEECRAMIKRFDLNGDGVISFEEFSVMMH